MPNQRPPSSISERSSRNSPYQNNNSHPSLNEEILSPQANCSKFLLNITLHRRTTGDFGFSLRRQVYSHQTEQGLERKELFFAEPQVDANDSPLMTGDQLIKVDGVEVNRKSQKEIVHLIKNPALEDRVVITILRNNKNYVSDDSRSNYSDREGGGCSIYSSSKGNQLVNSHLVRNNSDRLSHRASFDYGSKVYSIKSQKPSKQVSYISGSLCDSHLKFLHLKYRAPLFC